jgi:hypothetical protein
MSDSPNEPTPLDDLALAARRSSLELALLGLVYLVGYLFGIALLSLVAVMAFGWLGDTVRDLAWCGGALLALVGLPLGWVRFGWIKRGDPPSESENDGGKVVGLAGSILIMSLVGLFFGIVMAIFAAVLWLSWAVSPFAPASWRQGVALGIFSLSAHHPLLWQLLGGIVAAFVLLGLILGVILGLLGQVKRHH